MSLNPDNFWKAPRVDKRPISADFVEQLKKTIAFLELEIRRLEELGSHEKTIGNLLASIVYLKDEIDQYENKSTLEMGKK